MLSNHVIYITLESNKTFTRIINDNIRQFKTLEIIFILENNFSEKSYFVFYNKYVVLIVA